MDIGSRIRKFAIYFGSLKDLAEGLDMSTQSLNSYLVGKREPGAKVLSKLAKLGCNIHWLFTGEGEMVFVKEECRATLPIPLGASMQHFLLNTDTLFDMSFAKPWHWFGCGVISNTRKDIALEKDDYLVLRKIVDDFSRKFQPPQSSYELWYPPDSDSYFTTIDIYRPINDPYGEIEAHEYKYLESIIRESVYVVEYVIRRPIDRNIGTILEEVPKFVFESELIRGDGNADWASRPIPFPKELIRKS